MEYDVCRPLVDHIYPKELRVVCEARTTSITVEKLTVERYSTNWNLDSDDSKRA
jgi:hypothetical protein